MGGHGGDGVVDGATGMSNPSIVKQNDWATLGGEGMNKQRIPGVDGAAEVMEEKEGRVTAGAQGGADDAVGEFDAIVSCDELGLCVLDCWSRHLEDVRRIQR